MSYLTRRRVGEMRAGTPDSFFITVDDAEKTIVVEYLNGYMSLTALEVDEFRQLLNHAVLELLKGSGEKP